LDNANVPLSLRELFVKLANAKMEEFVVTANVSALNFLLEFFVMLSVFKGSTINSQDNVNASQIMMDQLVINVNARILEDVISMAVAIALNSLRELFVKNVSVETEEIVLMVNVRARQTILENFVKLDVCKGPSVFNQTFANALKIMKDLLVNNVNV
jgi:hypothetical protein